MAVICKIKNINLEVFVNGRIKKYYLWVFGLVSGLLPTNGASANGIDLAFLITPTVTKTKTHPQKEQETCEKVEGVRKGICLKSREKDHSRLQIGGNYTRAHIKVSGQPSFKGNLGGAQGMYEYCPKNNLYAAISANWKQGKTDNDVANRKLVYVDIQERVGYTYATSCKNWTISLFSGVGYRHLGHHLTQSGTNIKFQYNEIYIPLGFVSDYMFSAWFAGGLNFIWMPQVYPTVKISPLKGARWILKKPIENFLVELPLTFFMPESRQFSLILKPFYERWEDGRSTAKSESKLVLGLPGNTYNFWGIELNLAYTF